MGYVYSVRYKLKNRPERKISAVSIHDAFRKALALYDCSETVSILRVPLGR